MARHAAAIAMSLTALQPLWQRAGLTEPGQTQALPVQTMPGSAEAAEQLKSPERYDIASGSPAISDRTTETYKFDPAFKGEWGIEYHARTAALEPVPGFPALAPESLQPDPAAPGSAGSPAGGRSQPHADAAVPPVHAAVRYPEAVLRAPCGTCLNLYSSEAVSAALCRMLPVTPAPAPLVETKALAPDVDAMQTQLDVLTQRVQSLLDVPAPPSLEALMDLMDAMQTQLDGLTQTVGATTPAPAHNEMQSQLADLARHVQDLKARPVPAPPEDAMQLARAIDEIKGQIAPLEAHVKDLQDVFSQLEAKGNAFEAKVLREIAPKLQTLAGYFGAAASRPASEKGLAD
ncbi:unnamed protein product [Prorocentrum cordatum]|uniref:Mediator of RNA polymerase II transcription subunit 7 n=1 Tax=Prorocentrum cordatum TaxID=2364126 RepID=A0ABN9XXE8_9DINO|nr:unnamed protein product [Polarella glacialis]